MALDKFKYKGEVIVFAGYKMEDKFCFYYYKDYQMIYLSKHQVEKLEKIEKTEDEILAEKEIEEYFRKNLFERA